MRDSSSTKRQWRRVPVRLSVRSMMVLVLLAGVGLGWYIQRVRGHREAVAMIKAAGGHVTIDWQRSFSNRGQDPRPRWRLWLANQLGTDPFEKVLHVSLSGTSLDAEMEAVGRLDSLEGLNIGYRLSDANLAPLRGLRRLKRLYIEGDTITETGLEHLAGLTQLESLELLTTPVDDAGLAHLSGLTSLKELAIYQGAQITDAGLAHVAKLKSLQRLVIRGSRITDDGLAPVFSQLPLLIHLNLSGSDITDAGLVHLTHWHGLEKLDVRETRVTDAGAEALRRSLHLLRVVEISPPPEN